MNPSFLDQLLSYPERESLIIECPALALFCFQEFVSAIQDGRNIIDPIINDDEVSVLLSSSSISEVTERVFADSNENTKVKSFWTTLREALECAWNPTSKNDKKWSLYEISGKSYFYSKTTHRIPLAQISLQNTLDNSRKFIKSITACALAGSIEPLGEKKNQPIAAMLQFSRLIPPLQEENNNNNNNNNNGITCEGMNFCMQPLQQQWWTLLSVALDRVLALTHNKGVSRATLWQLLAILFELDTSQFVYPFPTKEEDFIGFHLLARLSEIGLVYPLKCEEKKCFVLSPHFHHAISWSTTSPLCTCALLDDEGNPSQRVRREDEDTIITETNFRLYAYTKNPDLLNILNQFAVKEADVDSMIACYRVTRASFATALQKGISATHILRFLAVKAHPSMMKHQSENNSEILTYSSITTNSAKRLKNSFDKSNIGGVIPQSFCDQLLTWEKECRRLIFRRDLILLRNISTTQREVLMEFLSHSGELHAVVHQESGYLVLQRDAYERVLASIISNE